MVTSRYPRTEPFDGGMLEVGAGHAIHWQVAGNPDGKPAVLLHGGPGAGSAARHRQLFDPTEYRVIQFDQRNCGMNTPSAAEPEVDLSANTTQDLIDDIERLREFLGIDRWLVWGGSWGTTLGLAYAQAHPLVVTELLLASVVTTSESEVDWATRAMGRLFPEQWREFVDLLPEDQRHGNLALAYNRLLMNPDSLVHNAAALAWCDWEDVHVSIPDGYEPSLRNAEPTFRLGLSRVVTHYWGHAGFLENGQLISNAHKLAGIPTFMAHGRRDISAPVDIAVKLAAEIDGSVLYICEEEGHGGPALTDWMISVTDRLAAEAG
ncbi:MAG: alpha/beta fold hydrolase [Acidimicrobiales bacterium]